MNEVNKILEDRGKVYGDYEGGILLRSELMHLIKKRYVSVNKDQMKPLQIESICDIINKITRIAVTPDHIDSWLDIAGYATKTKEMLENATKSRPKQPNFASHE